jgi:DNA ligase-associated metallophosphoesterase
MRMVSVRSGPNLKIYTSRSAVVTGQFMQPRGACTYNCGMRSIPLAGAELVLLPERAAFVPAEATLLVADAHFGKSASFRALGVPVPRGTTTENLARLTGLIARLGVRRLVFLGDFLHSRHGRAAATLAALEAWRDTHRTIEMMLVRGNHDDRAGDPPASLGFAVVDEPFALGSFALCHHPQARDDGSYVLAGHLHPAIRLSGRIDSVRLPCFWFGPQTGVLPAFGSFTGGHAIAPVAGDQVYAVVDDAVVAVPGSRWREREGDGSFAPVASRALR